MKVFEYMAAGRPVVASDLSILREFLRHEENALLVPAGDPMAWAEAIRRLRDDAELRKHLAQNAFGELKNNFTWDKRAETVLDFAGGRKTSILYASGKVA